MFCSKCGEPAVQDAKFCSKCGVSLLPSALPTAQPEPKPIAEIIPAPSQVRPLVRFWARMFDVSCFSLVGGVIQGVIAPHPEKLNLVALEMMLVFAWVFVEALLLSSFQTTPGKWLFKTKIALTSGSPINFSQALARSFKVWWRGCGTGFPIVTMITKIIAHGRLTRNGITSWDKDDGFYVEHETIGVPRLLVLAAIAFFFVFLVFVATGNSANQIPSTEVMRDA
jgi:uncharacterized RDD family membrane protein YckC